MGAKCLAEEVLETVTVHIAQMKGKERRRDGEGKTERKVATKIKSGEESQMGGEGGWCTWRVCGGEGKDISM